MNAEADAKGEALRAAGEKPYVIPGGGSNRVGALAEQEGHHPALLTEWGRVTVSWWTHAIGGLHRNDFILAARTDTLYAGHP